MPQECLCGGSPSPKRREHSEWVNAPSQRQYCIPELTTSLLNGCLIFESNILECTKCIC